MQFNVGNITYISTIINQPKKILTSPYYLGNAAMYTFTTTLLTSIWWHTVLFPIPREPYHQMWPMKSCFLNVCRIAKMGDVLIRGTNSWCKGTMSTRKWYKVEKGKDWYLWGGTRLILSEIGHILILSYIRKPILVMIVFKCWNYWHIRFKKLSFLQDALLVLKKG